MELVNHFSFIQAAAHELISAKPSYYYTHDLIQQVYNHPHLKCQIIQIPSSNSKDQSFNSFYIFNKLKQSQPCIIYLHEGQFLIPEIQTSFNLCIYDLRGHGKSKFSRVTYGLQQSADLYDVINTLNYKGVTQIYLWGRSMGASTILNFLSNHWSELHIKQIVKLVILDSAFCSFQQIAKQTVGRNLGLPAFICSPLINVTLNKILQNEKINLRSLDFSCLQKVNFPAVFLYSHKDEVVSFQHSENIINGYGGRKMKLIGEFTHNQVRPNYLVKEVFKQINVESNKMKINLGKSIVSKKGLSISLISSKNLGQEEKENRPDEKEKILRSLSPYCKTHRGNININIDKLNINFRKQSTPRVNNHGLEKSKVHYYHLGQLQRKKKPFIQKQHLTNHRYL